MITLTTALGIAVLVLKVAFVGALVLWFWPDRPSGTSP